MRTAALRARVVARTWVVLLGAGLAACDAGSVGSGATSGGGGTGGGGHSGEGGTTGGGGFGGEGGTSGNGGFSGGGGSSGASALLFEEDFDSTTWYSNPGWGARVTAGTDPRFGCSAGSGLFERVVSGANGVTLIDGPAGHIRILATTHCGANAGIMLEQLMPALPGPGDSMYFRYYVAFADTFDAAQNGKLPGWGDDQHGNCGAGGNPCDGTGGWSARGKHFSGDVCEADPAGVQVPLDSYVYHGTMPSQYGDNFDWTDMGCGEPNVAMQGTWYCVEQKITMNTGSNDDGELDAWVDGVQVLDRNDVLWDSTGEFPIYRVWIDVYHGGGQAAPQDMDLYIDHIAVSASPIGCDL